MASSRLVHSSTDLGDLLIGLGELPVGDKRTSTEVA